MPGDRYEFRRLPIRRKYIPKQSLMARIDVNGSGEIAKNPIRVVEITLASGHCLLEVLTARTHQLDEGRRIHLLVPARGWARGGKPEPIAQPQRALDLNGLACLIRRKLHGHVLRNLCLLYTSPKAFAAFETRIGIQLTDQQRATVLGAVRTAAGMIETMLDQGSMRLAHVDVANPAVRAEAANAINSVPKAAAALNMTVDGAARMIVGAVNTRLHGVGTSIATPATARGAPR